MVWDTFPILATSQWHLRTTGEDRTHPRRKTYLFFHDVLYIIVFFYQLLICRPKAKVGPPAPSNQRHIAILSALYCVFSSCLFKQLFVWHDRWCPLSICGGRPGADALQTAIEIGLTFEEAVALHQRGLLLVSLDLSKFFGSIEQGLIDGVVGQLGMPDCIRSAFSRLPTPKEI